VLVDPPAYFNKLLKRTPVRAIASSVAKPLRALIEPVIASIVKVKRYGLVLKWLGSPSTDEMVVIFQKALLWADRNGAGFDGQVANFSGRLFQRVRKTLPAFTRSLSRAADKVADYNRQLLGGAARNLSPQDLERTIEQQLAAGNSRLFRKPSFFENVFDRDDKELTDGLRAAFNGNGQDEILVLGWDEVKFESVAQEVLEQFDKGLVRMRSKGIKLADGRFFPPNKIRFPKQAGVPGGRPFPELSAYLENVPAGSLVTPRGLQVNSITVPQANRLREMVRDFLIKYRKRLLS
jgi:hypothetical protein